MLRICSLGRAEIAADQDTRCNGRLHEQRSIRNDFLTLIELRFGVISEGGYVCDAHLNKFIHFYSAHQVYCSDPFLVHSRQRNKVMRKGTMEISLDLHGRAKAVGLVLVPGKRLCVCCKIMLHKRFKEA